MAVTKVAVVQAAPVLFDRDATIDKAVRLIGEAGASGANVILLPEAFVPAYPRGFSFGMVVGSRTEEGRALWQRYRDNSIEVPSASTEALAQAASDANAYVAIGITERAGGTLYCSLLYFSPDGKLIGNHRKLKPTGAERLIWGEGDGSTMPVFDTPFGKLGGLICWENYMPLARTALYGKGIELYLAPTADSRDGWQASMRHVALEGRCYLLSCNQFVSKAMYPTDLPSYAELERQPEIMSRGGSVIVCPMGDVIAGPLWDEEGILYADLDMDAIGRSKLDFDPVGHYARPDVFQLTVNEQPQQTVAQSKT